MDEGDSGRCAAFSLKIPISGGISDLYWRDKLLMIGLALFFLSSIVATIGISIGVIGALYGGIFGFYSIRKLVTGGCAKYPLPERSPGQQPCARKGKMFPGRVWKIIRHPSGSFMVLQMQ